MTFISKEEEAALIAGGEKPYSLRGRTEFAIFGADGAPTGQLCRCYRPHPTQGNFAFHALSDRLITPEELDAAEMRSQDGTLLATTYGEWKKEQLNVST